MNATYGRKTAVNGIIEIDFVHGKDWDEIQENARKIASIPGGTVTCKSNLGLRQSKEKGDYFASFVVVRAPENPPVLPESPEGTYFRTEDLGQAFMDAGYMNDIMVPEISIHLPRYSRPSGSYYTIRELKRGLAEVIPNNSYLIDKAAAQADKNRVYDAFRKDLP